MDCPECNDGRIRVLGSTCTCGHHQLICDTCNSFFTVECGPPFGPNKLPPKFAMNFDEDTTNVSRQIEKKLKKIGVDLKHSQEEHNKRITELALNSPLLEDFSANNCKWNFDKNTPN